VEPGFYGKLPSHGDFVRRRVSDAFVGAWDSWLQDCLAASRSALGDRWLDVYLTSPVWRFGCAAGACGPTSVIGVMVPSVDRVGRYFPLTLVAELPSTANLLAAATEYDDFFTAAERLLVDTLGAERVDLERFDAEVVQLRVETAGSVLPRRVALEPAAAGIVNGRASAAWHVRVGSLAHMAPMFEQLLEYRLSAVYDPLVLWWTDGSSAIEPSCLIGQGLPQPDQFTALLDGGWIEREWCQVTAHAGADLAPADTLIDDVAPPRFRSAAASDVGRVRRSNQDAFIERTDVGIWAVADGLGGHTDGDVASRMVCDALADITPDSSFEDTIDAVRARMADVNSHLVRVSARSIESVHSGSTVVALLARGSRCAVMWAGDSRAYRWRAGQLTQLTRDHSLAEHAVTRAVGGEVDLALDVRRDRVRAGDRFLLCSDGLTRIVSEPILERWLAQEDIRAAVDALLQAALEAGAPDNVTILIVEACA
jgi:type VI secretion system protein ImpM